MNNVQKFLVSPRLEDVASSLFFAIRAGIMLGKDAYREAVLYRLIKNMMYF